jgi:hypothetical protein
VCQPAKIVSVIASYFFCAAARPRHDAVVEALDVQICRNRAAVEVGPLRQNVFLSELIKRLSQIDARLKHRGRLLEHGEIFYQFSFACDASMAWNNLDVVWRMRQDVLRHGNGALWASAAIVIRIDRWKMWRIKIREVVPCHHNIGLRKENNSIAVRVAVLKMHGMNLSANHVQSDLIGESNRGERFGQIRNSRIA